MPDPWTPPEPLGGSSSRIYGQDEQRNEQRVRSRSFFPLVLTALVIGALGWLISRSPAEEPVVAIAPRATAPTSTALELEPGVDPPDADERGTFRLLGGARDDGRRVSFMQLSITRSRPIDTDIHIVDGEELRTVQLAEPMQALGVIDVGREHPGEIRDYLLTLDHGVLITNLGRVGHQRIERGTQLIDLGRGFSFFRGPTASSAWVLGSAERTARLIDIDERGRATERRSEELGGVGRPIDADGEYLILGLLGTDPNHGFGVLGPDGFEPITETRGLSYLGSGGGQAVFGLSGPTIGEPRNNVNVIIKSLAAPDAPGRTLELPTTMLYRTQVSPDGKHLAISIVTDLNSPNILAIYNLETGAEVDRISSSVEIGFRWTSLTEVVYLRPDWPAVDLVERDITTGIDQNLVHFDDLSWRFSALPR